ncbi:hypothetical protein [Endozoicomonas atrinae]|uniref:hypothetical protein n=1 Tax=Endozoicomonas atrinae TaxID=1333660 RepID=UPI000826E970|nr:hypothetical protein [Endozoicomonas atrinae]
MNTLISVLTWPFRATFSLILLALMPVWLSSIPFITANSRVDAWLCRHLGPVGALLMLLTPFIWVPVFLVFWTLLYGYSLHFPVEAIQNFTPSIGDLLGERAGAHREIGSDAISLLSYEFYHWVRRIPVTIIEIASQFVELAKMRVDSLFGLYVNLLGYLTIIRVLFYMVLDKNGTIIR